jgi:DNA modification methylase
MKEQIIQVDELPNKVEFNSTFEITSTTVSYCTHGFFKYPCKFIPHIPRWAIFKYTKQKQLVLDPFAGSGTTLVEAVLHKRNALGVDFDKLSQLLCNTKTQILNNCQVRYIRKTGEKLFGNTNKVSEFKPDIHNIQHWFPEQNIRDLLYLKASIESYYTTTKDIKIYNFLLVCFASIIKKCSYADDVSPKPYVSKKIKKEPLSVKDTFVRTLNSYLKNIEEYSGRKFGKAFIISDDARNIQAPKYQGRVALAVTSPPYINAFDYVRSLRLENAWLGYYGDSNIIEIKKKQVGTETIPSNIYEKGCRESGFKKLDSILFKIGKKDKKRAFVVYKFFNDISKNFKEVNRLLMPNAHYVVVIGDSRIRGVNVPTHEILIDIAKKNGYRLENLFSYIIKNRYLRIPRSGRGGLIKKDWVVDLVKTYG